MGHRTHARGNWTGNEPEDVKLICGDNLVSARQQPAIFDQLARQCADMATTGKNKFRYGETSAGTTVVVLKPFPRGHSYGVLRKIGLQIEEANARYIEWKAWFNKVDEAQNRAYNDWLDNRVPTKERDKGHNHGIACNKSI